MLVGVISDTHGLIRPEVEEALEGCEVIFHAGDINSQEVLDALNEIAPVKVVRGNNDKEWAVNIPYVRSFEYGGIKVCMSHKKKDLPEDLLTYDLVVTGHTHVYNESRQGHTLFLNPGSCGPRRRDKQITMAVLEITNRDIKVKRIEI